MWDLLILKNWFKKNTTANLQLTINNTQWWCMQQPVLWGRVKNQKIVWDIVWNSKCFQTIIPPNLQLKYPLLVVRPIALSLAHFFAPSSFKNESTLKWYYHACCSSNCEALFVQLTMISPWFQVHPSSPCFQPRNTKTSCFAIILVIDSFA